MAHPRVSVVIPVYKPDVEVLNYLKNMLKKQTVPVEIIEKWNNPEAVSMNLGIKEAKGELIIILAQDCIPSDERYIEKMIRPLKNEDVVAVVSDLLLPKRFWEKRPFLIKMFTISDLKLRKPVMNLSSCAYRKKDLEKMGYVNEQISAIDLDFYFKIQKLGRIERGNAVVYHIHPHKDFRKTLKTFYSYSKFNGNSVREEGIRDLNFLQRVIRGLPLLGFCSIYYRYPLKNYSYLIPIHFLYGALIEHTINIIGFWHGFIFGEVKGERNKEALKSKGQVNLEKFL